MNRRIRNVIFAVMLTAFTVYSVLDTFVISRAYAVVQTDQAAQTESVSADTSGTGSGGSETDAASGTSDAGSDTSEEEKMQDPRLRSLSSQTRLTAMKISR